MIFKRVNQLETNRGQARSLNYWNHTHPIGGYLSNYQLYQVWQRHFILRWYAQPLQKKCLILSAFPILQQAINLALPSRHCLERRLLWAGNQLKTYLAQKPGRTINKRIFPSLTQKISRREDWNTPIKWVAFFSWNTCLTFCFSASLSSLHFICISENISDPAVWHYEQRLFPWQRYFVNQVK